MKRTAILLFAAAVAAAAGTAACTATTPATNGKAAVDYRTPPAASTETAAPASLRPSIVPGPAAQLKHVSTATLVRLGHTATLTIEQSDPVPATIGLTNDFLMLNGLCPVDPATDAVVAYAVSITNTTPDLPTAFSAEWSFRRADVVERVELIKYGHRHCDISEIGGAIRSEKPLVTGDTTTALGFMILHGYYSAAHPAPVGDPEAVRHAVLGLRWVMAGHSGPYLKPTGYTGNMVELNAASGLSFGVSLVPAEQPRNCWTTAVPCPLSGTPQ